MERRLVERGSSETDKVEDRGWSSDRGQQGAGDGEEVGESLQ